MSWFWIVALIYLGLVISAAIVWNLLPPDEED